MLLLSVASSRHDGVAETLSAATLLRSLRQGVKNLIDEHRQWWHNYYPKSFVSIPDARLQSFYWIQLYKIASSTRSDRPVVSTTGPWLEPTPWPGVWWNLNVQLSYWLIHATNHPELDSLTTTLDEGRAQLAQNVAQPYRDDSYGIGRATQPDLKSDPVIGIPGVIPSGDFDVPEIGNLTWALHNVWLAYRHSMDERTLEDILYPLLRRAINYYLHFLEDGSDGRLHLPVTYSPEYALTRDCNYDLALLRWGCQTLLDLAKRLKLEDELAHRWEDVVGRLVNPPQGEDGLWIGADARLTSSHRHYSHLLWFYPLYILDPTDPVHADTLRRSLEHWLSFPGALQGYTFTGAASMSASLGDGQSSITYLHTLFDHYVSPNTMYEESGPVLETPLSAAQTVHEMLLQSWGDTIRVFPAIPAWGEASFHDLRAQGAFLVSAKRTGGKTVSVRVKSLAGEPLRLMHGISGPVAVTPVGDRNPVVAIADDGALILDLHKGDEVIVFPNETVPDITMGPVGRPTSEWRWGLPTSNDDRRY